MSSHGFYAHLGDSVSGEGSLILLGHFVSRCSFRPELPGNTSVWTSGGLFPTVFYAECNIQKGFPGGSGSLPAIAGDTGFNLWVGKIPWRRKWQPMPVFLPGESHGQRSLAGYSPWDGKELDTTK